jgi:hypothetical protein
VGTDPKTDLALLKVEGSERFSYVASRQKRRASVTGRSPSATVRAWRHRHHRYRRHAAATSATVHDDFLQSMRRSIAAIPVVRRSISMVK